MDKLDKFFVFRHRKNKKRKDVCCYCKSTVRFNSQGRDAHTNVKGRTIRNMIF